MCGIGIRSWWNLWFSKLKALNNVLWPFLPVFLSAYPALAPLSSPCPCCWTHCGRSCRVKTVSPTPSCKRYWSSLSWLSALYCSSSSGSRSFSPSFLSSPGRQFYSSVPTKCFFHKDLFYRSNNCYCCEQCDGIVFVLMCRNSISDVGFWKK